MWISGKKKYITQVTELIKNYIEYSEVNSKKSSLLKSLARKTAACFTRVKIESKKQACVLILHACFSNGTT